MSNYVEVKTQRALFINGKQITEWEEYEIHKRTKEIVLYNDDGFVIYDKESGTCLYVWENKYDATVGSYEFREKHIVLCDNTNSEVRNYQIISYRGYILLPFEFEAKRIYYRFGLNKLATSSIFYICTKEGKKGYYFSKTNQFIEGSRMEKDPSRFHGAYKILHDGKVSTYVLKNGKYICKETIKASS